MNDKRLEEYRQKKETAKRSLTEKDTTDLFDELRDPFLRDRDRIIYTRAFRRLKDKTQVYTSKKGAHFRSRLTHTIEVSQIARSIATQLKLSSELTEAIAYGHDVGHTPFGHAGERVLDEILIGADEINEIKNKCKFNGFKHNFYGLKILDNHIRKYKNDKGEIIKGLDLHWQVLEGILKHTKIKRKKCLRCRKGGGLETCNDCWDIKRYLNSDRKVEELYLNNKNSVTLEGQVVAIADEIAQIEHDLDDGIRNKKLNIDTLHIIEEILNFCGVEDDDIKRLQKSFKILKNESKKNLKGEKAYIQDKIVKDIIDYFIRDIVKNSIIEVRRYIEEKNMNSEIDMIFEKKVIKFSENGDKIHKILEKIVQSKILNSTEVARFDWKARYIIRNLFKAYYTNPKQMPNYILESISLKVKEAMKKSEILFCFEKSCPECDLKNILEIDYESEIRYFEEYTSILKLEFKKEMFKRFQFSCIKKDETIDFMFEDDLEKFIADDLNEYFYKEYSNLESIKEKYKKLLIELNYIYIFSIIEHIANMTDTFARDEFKALYSEECE